ncbi:hypothetical protein DVH24_016040, partial [Malus domestica]
QCVAGIGKWASGFIVPTVDSAVRKGSRTHCLCPFHPQPPPPSGWYTLLGKTILHFGRAYTVVEGSRCLLRRHFKMQKKAFGQTSMASAVTPLCQIIDTIDWNPNIDRALVKEVDHEYFARDEGEGKGKIGQTNKKAKYSDFVPLDEHNTILDDRTNPWECDNILLCLAHTFVSNYESWQWKCGEECMGR